MARTTTTFRLLTSVLALTALASTAHAQVNVEALRSDLGDRTRYLAIQANFAGHVGNVNGAVAGGSAFAGATFGDHTLFAKAQGDYAQFSGTATVAKAFGHVRYNYRFLPWLFGEVFVQVEEDKFERLALRQLDGIGVRFGIVQKPAVQLYYGTAWMLDYEKLADDALPGGGTFQGPRWVTQRWSHYVAVGWKMNSRARLSNVLYVQPRFVDPGDLRILNDAAFAVDIDKRFSAKIDCQVHYSSLPPTRVLSTDVDTITSLVLTL